MGSIARKLTLVEAAGKNKRYQKLGLFLCECGNKKVYRVDEVQAGKKKSCGCLQNLSGSAAPHYIHGATRDRRFSPEYESWRAMKQRCFNPANNRFQYYGGRGITVCPKWKNSFSQFLHDMGARPTGTSLDRIDPNGNYEPQNCRWATDTEQRFNTTRKRAA